jgi:hypothetical protein
MNKYLIIFTLLLITVIGYLIHINNNLNKNYKTSMENIKAYDLELSNARETNRVFKLTVEQLNYFKDSILVKMNAVRKELGIKDSKIEQMQYQLSHVEKADSIILKDTIFVKSFKLDTIIGDEWYQNHITMRYPNYIKMHPKFKIESFLFVESKKETINPPKKFFLFKWFQKKHIILNITVHENNPYVEIEKQKFIEIIK